jgi:hypothetical protein
VLPSLTCYRQCRILLGNTVVIGSGRDRGRFLGTFAIAQTRSSVAVCSDRSDDREPCTFIANTGRIRRHLCGLYNCITAEYILAVSTCGGSTLRSRECAKDFTRLVFTSALLWKPSFIATISVALYAVSGTLLVATGVLILANLPDDDMNGSPPLLRRAALRLTLCGIMLASV